MHAFSYALSSLTLCALLSLHAYSQTRCDTLRSCLGNVLTFSASATSYVDIQQTPAQRSITTALTFEAWILVERALNLRQFIAGLWGPNTDANDVWILYIAPNDELVFEINGTP
ncbi:MAG: hypothetical protein RML40_09885, partial [Bacteroidota bacterium]|nr:hypothetical protein [Candidatus Kapabacteria bacterium]MDW8220828.1 hypothetical protein [Bacteroidota bacterium]